LKRRKITEGAHPEPQTQPGLQSGTKPYHTANLILAGLIALVLVYSGIFSAEKDNHPVPSFFEETTGRTSPSSGLSRAFSEILRGEIDSALAYNPDSLRIFIFLMIQLVQRLSISLLLFKTRLQLKPLLLADIILSAGLFIYAFTPLVFQVIEMAGG
jgi:hypothetical protein